MLEYQPSGWTPQNVGRFCFDRVAQMDIGPIRSLTVRELKAVSSHCIYVQ